MPILENAKRTIERVTGYRRPDARELGLLTRDRKAHLLRFKDDGETPNNARLAMILYRTPVRLPDRFDPAVVFEDLFAANGWADSWRDGMYDFLHFHTHTHEVLGIARGSVRAIFRRKNIMNRRRRLSLTTMALLIIAVVSATAIPQIGFAQTNQPSGMWRLNLAKSQFSPGPPPRSQTLTYETVGQGFRATNEGIDAQGNPTKSVFGVYFYDGKSYPVTGVSDFDASSYKVVNESAVEMTRTKAGKVVQTQTRVMSADGKTLSFRATGINAKGQQINNIAVYDKE